MFRPVLVAVVAATAVSAPASADETLTWADCPDAAAATYHAQCATLAVPLDWSAPSGPTLDLALMRIPATEQSRGPVLADSQEVNGYGGSQLAFFLQHGDNYLARLPETHRTHDLVLFDPRGLGRSTPVHCPTSAHDPAVPLFPTGPADVRAMVDHGRSVSRACSGPRHTDLASQAADVDAIRRALGASRLDWMGQAVGAELGVVYAARYPGTTGRLVLDTVVDPYLPAARRVLDAAQAEETAFTHFANWCTATPDSCPLADPRQYLDHLVAKGVPGMTADEVRITVGQYLLGYPVAWPGLAHAMISANAGDASELAPFLAATYDEPDYTATRAQVCADDPITPAALPALAHTLRAIAPHTTGTSLHWDAVAGCAGWPVSGPSPRLPQRVTLPTPALVTANTGDPINPYSWARDVATRLHGTLLTSTVDGHGSLDNSPCAATAIDAFLATGARPGTCL